MLLYLGSISTTATSGGGYGFLLDYPSACPEVDHSENDCSAPKQFDAETVLAVVHGAEAVLSVVHGAEAVLVVIHGADEAVSLVSPGTAVQLPYLIASRIPLWLAPSGVCPLAKPIFLPPPSKIS
jgi:hypothetical protein